MLTRPRRPSPRRFPQRVAVNNRVPFRRILPGGALVLTVGAPARLADARPAERGA